MNSIKREITYAAVKLFSEKGVKKTSYYDIAELVSSNRGERITRQGVQYHFPQKEQLLQEIFILMDALIESNILKIELSLKKTSDPREYLSNLVCIISPMENSMYMQILRILFCDQLYHDSVKNYLIDDFMHKIETYLSSCFETLINLRMVKKFNYTSITRIFFRTLFTYLGVSVLSGTKFDRNDVKRTTDCDLLIEMIVAGSIPD